MEIFHKKRRGDIPTDPLWDVCGQLVEQAPYEAVSDKPHVTHMRTVTWAQFPYRYLLVEYAITERTGTILPREQIQPRLYELDRASATDIDTGEHEFTQYFLARKGILGVLHNNIKPVAERSQDDNEIYLASFRFAFDNGLTAPNAFDTLEAESSLSLGMQDGVEPYFRNH